MTPVIRMSFSLSVLFWIKFKSTFEGFASVFVNLFICFCWLVLAVPIRIVDINCTCSEFIFIDSGNKSDHATPTNINERNLLIRVINCNLVIISIWTFKVLLTLKFSYFYHFSAQSRIKTFLSISQSRVCAWSRLELGTSGGWRPILANQGYILQPFQLNIFNQSQSSIHNWIQINYTCKKYPI